MSTSRLKLLFVSGGNKGRPSAFIRDQASDLIKRGHVVSHFLIKGKGGSGYLKNFPSLYHNIINQHYDLIHAHYGLSGLLSVLQRRVKVIITFHGSDINRSDHRRYSWLALKLAERGIVVSSELESLLGRKRKLDILPCGVDLEIFRPVDREKAIMAMGLDRKKNYILFGGQFDNPVKNWELLERCAPMLKGAWEIIELRNFTREQVNLALNASHVLVLTSHSEGSPQIIKEAMACNRPIVVTPVGDVKWLLDDVTHTNIVKLEKCEVAKKINKYLDRYLVTNGRDRIRHLKLDSGNVTSKLEEIYYRCLV